MAEPSLERWNTVPVTDVAACTVTWRTPDGRAQTLPAELRASPTDGSLVTFLLPPEWEERYETLTAAVTTRYTDGMVNTIGFTVRLIDGEYQAGGCVTHCQRPSVPGGNTDD